MSAENASLGIEHFSDFSYLVRGVCALYAWIWLTYKVSRGDKSAESPSISPKSIITLILFVALSLEVFYNILATKIKYSEGFWAVSAKEIIPTPRKVWSSANDKWVDPCDYILAITFGLQTSALFLLQWFWNCQSTSILNTPLMSASEIRAYISWAIFSLPMFPALMAWLKTTSGTLDEEVFPRLVFASQLALVVVLGLSTHFRLTRLLRAQTGKDAHQHQVIAKVRRSIQMNWMLTVVLVIVASGYFVLCIDVITSHAINNSKFLSDVLLVNMHVATFIQWILLVLILHPTKEFIGSCSFSTIRTVHVDSEKCESLQTTGSGAANLPREDRTLPDTPKHMSAMPGYSQAPPGIELHAPSPTPDLQMSAASGSAASASATPSPLPGGPLLKRNLSISKDGRMIYADTKKLSKVGGSEFVAVEKVDPSTIPSYYFAQDGADPRQSLPALARDTASTGYQRSVSESPVRSDSIPAKPQPSHQRQPDEPPPNAPMRQMSMPTMNENQQLQQYGGRSVHSRESSRGSVSHVRRYSQQALQQLLHNQQQKIHQQQHKSVMHQQYRSHSRQSTQRLSSGLMMQEYTTTSTMHTNQQHSSDEQPGMEKRSSQLSIGSPPTEASFAMSDSTLSTPRVAFDGTPITITTTTTTFVSTDSVVLGVDPNARDHPLALRSMTPVTDASVSDRQSVSSDYGDGKGEGDSDNDRESYSRDTPTPTPRSVRNVEDAHDHGRPETPPRAPPSRLDARAKGAAYDRNLPSPTTSSSSRQSNGEGGSEATSISGENYFYAM